MPVKVETKPEIADLYQNVGDGFSKCEPILMNIKEAIESSTVLKKTTRNELLTSIRAIFEEANKVLDTIGDLGKLK